MYEYLTMVMVFARFVYKVIIKPTTITFYNRIKYKYIIK